MSNGFKSTREFLSLLYISFIRGSFFYKASLDKRYNLFDTTKFVDDPWPGDIATGKNILNDNIQSGLKTPLEILDFLLYKPVSDEYETYSKYLNSFFWIRDLQAIGGNNSLKSARKLIQVFIQDYRSQSKFWNRRFQWDEGVVGERLTNWILAYSFVAAGSSDDFQKLLFASLNEQYSHLLKSFKGVTNLQSRLLSIKGLLFCQGIMKNRNNRLIKNLFHEISHIIPEIITHNGMIKSRNPTELFNIFRSLIEIKFITKNLNLANIEFAAFEKLSDIVSCIRFLRLGNGEISEFCGDVSSSIDFIKPTRQIVDAAISTIDTSSSLSDLKSLGFERIATKKIIALINTKISGVKSKFNSRNEPGINVFDFEASFGTEKIVNRSDIALIANGFWIKAPLSSRLLSKRKFSQDGVSFEGEMQNFQNELPFAMRREIVLSSGRPNISGIDFIFMEQKYSGRIRFVLNKNCSISKTNETTFLIVLFSKKFKINFKPCDCLKKVLLKNNSIYPSIECLICCNSGDIQIEWMLEQLDN